jgi:7-cyano-7-deazaguanine synthase
VLFSGGVDSAILLGQTLRAGTPAWPLYVLQGYRWEKEELAAARRFHRALKKQFGARLGGLSVARLESPGGAAPPWASAAKGRAAAVPDEASPDEAVYLPGRNLALIAQGAMLALRLGVARVQLGTLKANPFPDARPAFFRAAERAVYEAMRWKIEIETPLARMNKTEALRAGAGLPLEFTISCLQPAGGIQCGRCNKCEERRRAFAEAGLIDGANYKTKNSTRRSRSSRRRSPK